MQAFYLGTRIFSGKEGLKEAMGDSQRIFLVTDSFLEQSKKVHISRKYWKRKEKPGRFFQR